MIPASEPRSGRRLRPPLVVDPNQLTKLEFDMEEAHNLSLLLLETLEGEECEIGLGAIVMALTMGRLLSPKRLSVDEEIAFIQAMLELSATYFTTGEAN